MDREMRAQIEMGELADRWMKGPLGQYVIGRCAQIIDDAKNKLVQVDPRASDKIREIQLDIWKAGALPGFLSELLAEGRQALNVLESTDDFTED